MFRLTLAIVSCAAGVAMTSVADAQIVRVGRFGRGVSIRAPFVSVDVLPFGGGTRVRAPFTSVNTGAYGYGYGYNRYGRSIYGAVPGYRTVPVYPRPVYPTPVYPTPAYPQANGYQAARPAVPSVSPQRLRASAQQLVVSLTARRGDGNVWLEYLAPNRIIQTIDRGGSPDSLRTLLTHYNGVVANPSLSHISSASGFRETHQGLQAFVEGPPANSPASGQTQDGNADPVPTRPPEDETDQPAPAVPVEPVNDRVNKEELEELPLPPVPTPI